MLARGSISFEHERQQNAKGKKMRHARIPKYGLALICALIVLVALLPDAANAGSTRAYPVNAEPHYM